MLSAEYFVIVDDIENDASGKVSLLGIGDRLYLSSFPMSVNGLKFAAKLVATEAAIIDTPVTVRIITYLDDEQISTFEITDSITIEKYAAWASLFEVNELLFPRQGAYQVKLFVDDKLLASKYLVVRDASETVAT